MSIWFYNCLPEPLFNESYSTVITSKNDELLGATISKDEQWRFPKIDTVPEKFKTAIIEFEDRYFLTHFGINPIATFKALHETILKGKKRGGSTITMQVIRLARKGKNRTIYEKIIEFIWATRLEVSLSKNQILQLYSSYAPFGGNVVGLEAASWRYFGVEPKLLSWGETCTLAVLPNSPSLMHLNKNRKKLKNKRNRLLKRLFQHQKIDKTTYQLALEEELPNAPKKLPQIAPHLLSRIALQNKNGVKIKTSLELNLQKQCSQLLAKHHNNLKHNQIHNGALLVLDVQTGKTLAYIGNTPGKGNGKRVDIITSNRSSGSILKPFLYAAMLTEGDILPNTLVSDVPTFIAGYTPKNYDLEYSGAVPAYKALIRSLNIPAVKMLQEYRIEKLINVLQKLGLKSIDKNSDYYGLSLILGGAEVNLWELCGAYAGMARSLNNFNKQSSKYNKQNYSPPTYYQEKLTTKIELNESAVLSAASIYLTQKALVEVHRPWNEIGWENFGSSTNISWKTGTSFGNRDAWAVGFNSRYVVGIWVGNATGDGRPTLTGVGSAAPILFDAFKLLPYQKHHFDPPYDELTKIATCKESGYRVSRYCNSIDTMWVNTSGLKTLPCPFHQLYHLDDSEQFRVNSSCYDADKIIHKSFFNLPPTEEWYYRKKHPTYKKTPLFRSDCMEKEQLMQFVYPTPNLTIFLPKNFNNTTEKVVFEVVHKNRNSELFWHLDNTYLGKTTQVHQLEIAPNEGKHFITAVDEKGNSISTSFEILTQ